MSAGDDGPGRREVAYRVFAAEYDDATHSYSESDEERAPSYVVTPTGARANRLFVVGVLTEIEQVGESNLRARVVDPTGAFVVYAGQYEPDPLAALQRLDPPAFVAVTGKARTFEPEDGDRVFSTLRPEAVNEVDADTRDRWVVRTAEHTLARVAAFADATERPERGEDLRRALLEDGVDPGLAAGIPEAMSAYGTTRAYLAAVRETALDAARVVADERDEVDPLDLAPGEGGDAAADLDANLQATGAAAAAVVDPDETTVAAQADETGVDGGAGGAGAATDETEAAATSAAGPDSDDEVDADASAVDADAADDAAAPAMKPDADAAVAAETEGETPAPETTAGAANPEPESEPEPEADTASAANTETPTASSDDPGAPADEPAGDSATEEDVDTDEIYEFDEEEREAVEEEFGMEFASGEDIPDAGSADIETPDPEVEPDAEPAQDAESEQDPESESEPEPEPAAESETDQSSETEPDAGIADDTDDAADDDTADVEADSDAAEGSLEDAVVETMRELAEEGDGSADRETLIERVAEDRGAGEDAVEDAVQDALMSGRCYESGDDGLTPI